MLQVFHSLLKAHAVEARNVVRQALEILTPSMPGRMEDGNTMLTHWTKKIILEEGHTGMHSYKPKQTFATMNTIYFDNFFFHFFLKSYVQTGVIGTVNSSTISDIFFTFTPVSFL